MKWLPLTFLLLLAATVSARCKLSRTATPHGEVFILENDLLRAEALSFGGRIHSLRLKSSGTEFLEPVEEKFTQASRLLPPTLISNQGGYTDWFWGERPPEPNRYETRVITETDTRVEIEMKGSAGRWEVTRRVTLRRGAKALEQEITLTNAGTGKATLGYWAHVVPNVSQFVDTQGEARLLIPGKKGETILQGRRTASLLTDGPQEVAMRQGDAFFALSEPWGAMVAPGSGEVLVVSSEAETFAPQGVLYHWQAGRPGDERSTLEMIHTPLPLAPTASARYRITLEPFANKAEALQSLAPKSEP